MEKTNFYSKRRTGFISRYNYGKKVTDLGEFVLSYATSCNLGCEYCYLNFVKTPVWPVLYKNEELMFQELEDVISNQVDRDFYINCGETMDSLLFDEHIRTVERIIDFLTTKAGVYNKNVTIELRTKTNNVDKMKSVESVGREKMKVVYATSLMPESIRKNFELKASSISERIDCLNKAIEKGMLIGLRFEPIIIESLTNESTEIAIKNLVYEYEMLIRNIKVKIAEITKIHSISLSTIRFTKEQFRFYVAQKSTLIWPEVVICPDGKYRYSRPIRIEIYKNLIELLKKYFGNTIINKIFLATEFDYIWESCGLKIKKMVEF